MRCYTLNFAVGGFGDRLWQPGRSPYGPAPVEAPSPTQPPAATQAPAAEPAPAATEEPMEEPDPAATEEPMEEMRTHNLEGEVIHFYHFGDLSGPLAGITAPLVNGFNDAVAALNESGGIRGATVEHQLH
jgi:hypothetical protein